MNKNLLKIIKYLAIIFLFYFLGILTHKYQLPPYYQIRLALKKIYYVEVFKVNSKILNEYNAKVKKIINTDEKKKLVKYMPGVNIWNDRYYFNLLNHEKIEDIYLLQQNRHNKQNIRILTTKKIKIIRVLCMINNNSYYSNWTKLDYKVFMIGRSCIHDEVVSKEFQPGEIILPSGGPVASDPTFIVGLEDINEVKINFKN